MKRVLIILILLQTVSMASTYVVHDVYINNDERIVVVSEDSDKKVVIRKNVDLKELKSDFIKKSDT